MMRLVSISLLLVFLFASCSSDVVFEEYQATSDNITWSKKDAKNFTFTIEEKGAYDIYFMLRYVTGYPWDIAHLAIEMNDEEQKYPKQKLFTFQLKDEKGDPLGEPSLDLWDVKQKYVLDTLLQKGVYHITMQHAMAIEPFPYVMELGVRVEKTKK